MEKEVTCIQEIKIMYKVVYSKFAKQWMVVAPCGVAQSAWDSRLTADQTARTLNRSQYDNTRK